MKEAWLEVISNPEFTKEVSTVKDTLHSDCIIIVFNDKKFINIVKKIWKFTNSLVLITSNENVEFIKYDINVLLATLISFGNELSNVAEKYLTYTWT